MSRRRRREEYEELEDEIQLDEALEPYEDEGLGDAAYAQDGYSYPAYEQDMGEYAVEYSEEHEEADHESRFRIALGMFDLMSIFAGIVVILVLVAMLLMLVGWLRTDIMHSALMLQSGLQ